MRRPIKQIRQKTGHYATRAQLDALQTLVEAAHMDEAWFGDVVEAATPTGRSVHVVHVTDTKREHVVTLKYAVEVLLEGISSPYDYVSKEVADTFETLVKDLGLKTTTEEELVRDNYDNMALARATEVGVYVYEVNGKYLEYWSYFGTEGFYFVRHDLDSGKDVLRKQCIPDGMVPKFLCDEKLQPKYNYMKG